MNDLPKTATASCLHRQVGNKGIFHQNAKRLSNKWANETDASQRKIIQMTNDDLK